MAALIIGFDQLTKFLVQANMQTGESFPVIANMFHITYILNAGAAFGILEHRTSFFVIIALVLVVAIVYLYPRLPADELILKWGTGALFGGAIGNLIDRIRIGYVIDFFDFRIWPIFNIADMCIVIGISCIIYKLINCSEKEEVQSK